jgi:hypothetical protein
MAVGVSGANVSVSRDDPIMLKTWRTDLLMGLSLSGTSAVFLFNTLLYDRPTDR